MSFYESTHLLIHTLEAFLQAEYGSSSIAYTSPIVALAVLQFGAGLAQTALVFKFRRYSLLHLTTRASSTQSGATAACDLVITMTLCYILYDAKSGVKKTDTLVNKLMIYAINRGAATSICAILNLIFFIGKPNTFIFMLFLEPSCQLYVISVVSMLMNRTHLRAQLQGGDPAVNDGFALNRISLSTLKSNSSDLEAHSTPGGGIFVVRTLAAVS
ncbi:hypothetical protein BDQ12DRAFT_722897 [Crucibulum laeve]|uniref:DUF6534 domain-containing protein n=1 Tax=Crucibulum laeve TaxID=68775 RepID=A0A5C3M2L4_9AGAR|nr:hypothetical protein BDQ12DRAFT_722897 [Crucibulum laeve]